MVITEIGQVFGYAYRCQKFWPKIQHQVFPFEILAAIWLYFGNPHVNIKLFKVITIKCNDEAILVTKSEFLRKLSPFLQCLQCIASLLHRVSFLQNVKNFI